MEWIQIMIFEGVPGIFREHVPRIHFQSESDRKRNGIFHGMNS